ncbi:MAG: lytic transglycosylase domain-containing protein [Campylobacterales bacterium]|nr:lytic transglycosylase domain-containing protein [Campylobacterales bacterium]
MRFLAVLAISFTFLAANYDGLFDDAGRKFGINPALLYAIAKTESSLNPMAVGNNKNGTQDIGIMQINTVHMPELRRQNISRDDLFDPQINIYVGSRILKRCINKHGYSYAAINCYNGRISNNDYFMKVLKKYQNSSFYAQALHMDSKPSVRANSAKKIAKNTKKRYKVLLIGDDTVNKAHKRYKKLFAKHHVDLISKYKDDSISQYWAEQNLVFLIDQLKPDLVLVSLGSNEIDSPDENAINQIVRDIEDSGKKFAWIVPDKANASRYVSILASMTNPDNIMNINDNKGIISRIIK